MKLAVEQVGRDECPPGGFNEAVLAALGVARDDGCATARVAIGFVDYGFDLLHPTLCNAAGNRSRFRFLWDQNRTPALAGAFDFDAAALDDWHGAALDREVAAARRSGSRRSLDAQYDPHANNYGRHGTVGGAHGTLMASIAAGTPFAGFRGAAPDAPLIAVQLGLLDHHWKEEDRHGRPSWAGWRPRIQNAWDGWRSYDESRQIINAVRYIHHRACWLGVDALVINLSIGAWAGSHDGHSAVEIAIAGLIREAAAAFDAGRGPRMIVVAGAGNAGAEEGHWQGDLSRDRPQTFEWVMQRHDPTQNKLEIWYEGRDEIDVAVVFPDGQQLRIAAGGTREIAVGGSRIGIAEHWPQVRGSRSCVRLLLHPPLFPSALFDGATDTCAFEIRLATRTSSSVEAHAWIERDDGAGERSWLSPCHPEATLCCLATIPGAIVVGGYDHHAGMADRPAPLGLSSLGPAPWLNGPAARLPHFVAPASRIWGARSKSRGFVETTGTSAAVALASGAIASRLAAHGAAAALPKPSGPWSPRLGHGPFRIDQSECTGATA